MRFRQEVSESGQILRLSSPIEYSAEALFTSLMQIGLPANVALKIPFAIVTFLKERADENEESHLLTTGDIRVAVVDAMETLVNTGAVSAETVSMWCAAYIRRYGNPANQFVKVIDNEEERDLNYDYIETVLCLTS